MKVQSIVFLAILMLSCGSKHSKPTVQNKPPNAFDTIVVDNSQYELTYSTQFSDIPKLVSYYNNKLDSAYRIRSGIYKPFEIQSLDSTINSDILERNRGIKRLIKEKGATEETFIGFKYLLTQNEPYYYLDSVFKAFPKKNKNSNIGEYIKRVLHKRKLTENQRVYDLSLLTYTFGDIQGNRITLKSIKKKFLLLDFWASWCFPCRSKNIKLARINSQLSEDANVSIVGITLDVNKKKWQDASAKDGLNFMTLSDLQGLESPFAKKMKIYSIPHSILIDKKGNILSIEQNEEEIFRILKSL